MPSRRNPVVRHGALLRKGGAHTESVSGKRHQSKRQLDDEIDEYYDQQALSQRRDNNSKNPQKERDDSAPSTTDFMFFAHAQFSTTALPSFYSRRAHDLHAQSIH